ncbi:hemerythrin domain-containing protein [Allopusillimonas soli]|uniref:Hemerythrin domain-containing protein n=1 Tax=Allopusillimonas soli TaxID=659016 RepID=A0A853FGG3_9BURK|nr:hemerythrin domain-containing protein [Allopusillimonas soli]NYT38959.1 hemerythrin domain-containing protein [Allopusillimonas soli]TEA70048.1 hemerythrin domain-containing protein [Allopusillimonas soli]
MNKSHIPAAQKSVLSQLIDDHRKVSTLLKKFKREKASNQKQQAANEACTAITVHIEIEEGLFYPFLRDRDARVFDDLLDEALVEHGNVKNLIEKIMNMSADNRLYEASVRVLGERVAHHVKEEEELLFPKIISKNVDLRELIEPMEKRRQHVLVGKVTA